MRYNTLQRLIVLCLVVLVLSWVLFFMFFLQDPLASQSNVLYRMAGPLSADDPQVLKILKNDFLDLPSSLPYNISDNSHIGSQDFTWPWINEHLQEMFHDQHGGFFVEAGALNGVYLSNTLWLEKNLGWTGLLIEPDRESYKELKFKHRKAWSSNTCISSESYPKQIILESHYVVQKEWLDKLYFWAYRGHSHEMRQDNLNKEDKTKAWDFTYSSVQCFPVLSYLLALNLTTVDLLSLDVQGTEALILETILKDTRVSIRVIVAEDEKHSFNHSHMDRLGYVLVASSVDHIYVKKGDGILDRRNVKARIAKLKADKMTPSSS
ncbi:uncharacterized protein LOC121855529 [Homarus americanus]|uniref:Star-like 8 n=1 Tax=Homarus americanus TaxID=6706 RepID=A0A8J5MKU4_HOMAM|nr:uncharacterized protein LOC121855529 [Homarus americanus]KAG7155091.1 Star-like 8 [Homarus americanus]